MGPRWVSLPLVQNNGHDGNTGEFFIDNPEVLNDFTHRSIHTEQLVGKQIVQAYYGNPHKKSYYMGCSTGGEVVKEFYPRFASPKTSMAYLREHQQRTSLPFKEAIQCFLATWVPQMPQGTRVRALYRQTCGRLSHRKCCANATNLTV